MVRTCEAATVALGDDDEFEVKGKIEEFGELVGLGDKNSIEEGRRLSCLTQVLGASRQEQ